jgi:hypothetical protein
MVCDGNHIVKHGNTTRQIKIPKFWHTLFFYTFSMKLKIINSKKSSQINPKMKSHLMSYDEKLRDETLMDNV